MYEATMSEARRPIVPNPVLGMIILLVIESMFFAGLVSALAIVQTADPQGVWPPFGEPPAPVMVGGAVMAALAVSAVTLFLTGRRLRTPERQGAGPLFLVTVILGGVAVAIQLVSAVWLFQQGLTFTSSPHGSFYYLIVGLHTFQLAGTALVMARTYGELKANDLVLDRFRALQLLWYFIVVVWLFLYIRVYF